MRGALVCLVALLAITAAANFIVFDKCTDKTFCDPLSCTRTTFPVGSCQKDPGDNGTMVIQCHKEVGICAEVVHFKDAMCLEEFETDAFVCNQCDYANNRAVWCNKVDFFEYLSLDVCQGCNDCVPFMNITRAECVSIRDRSGKILYHARYMGPVPCTKVTQKMWGPLDKDCKFRPLWERYVPEGRCMDGFKVDCVWN